MAKYILKYRRFGENSGDFIRARTRPRCGENDRGGEGEGGLDFPPKLSLGRILDVGYGNAYQRNARGSYRLVDYCFELDPA